MFNVLISSMWLTAVQRSFSLRPRYIIDCILPLGLTRFLPIIFHRIIAQALSQHSFSVVGPIRLVKLSVSLAVGVLSTMSFKANSRARVLRTSLKCTTQAPGA